MYGEWMDAVPLIFGKEWSKDYDRAQLLTAADYHERHGDYAMAEYYKNKARGV